VWVTGTSSLAQEYAETFCEQLLARAGGKQGYVLELASNDGTFLKPFQARGLEVLGIDPARNIAEMAEHAGVPTRAVFWSNEEAKRLRAEKGPAKMVFARNVLPHVAETRDFIQACRTILADDGVLSIEVHDASTIQGEFQYDSIYHEHLCYFTFETLSRLLSDLGFHIFDLAYSPINGGDLVLYARTTPGEESTAVRERRLKEKTERTNTEEKWQAFARQAEEHRTRLRALIEDAHAKKEKIVGYGASARSSTLLNFCGIGPELIPVIADLNPLKQGKYTAGTHIPIKSPEAVMQGRPDTVVLLGWNFAKEVKPYLAHDFGFRGRYIVPFPGMPRIESEFL
jgi:SAM-dependent methyltransferase